MRDLAKSMMRLPWALGLWSAQQMTNAVTPDGRRRSASSLDAVSASAESEMDTKFTDLYRAGERLQNGMVDAVADLASGDWRQPQQTMARAWETIGRSWDTSRGTDGADR